MYLMCLDSGEWRPADFFTLCDFSMQSTFSHSRVQLQRVFVLIYLYVSASGISQFDHNIKNLIEILNGQLILQSLKL